MEKSSFHTACGEAADQAPQHHTLKQSNPKKLSNIQGGWKVSIQGSSLQMQCCEGFTFHVQIWRVISIPVHLIGYSKFKPLPKFHSRF